MLTRSSRPLWTALSRWIRYNTTKSTAGSPLTKADNDEPPIVMLSEADVASMVIPGRSLYPPTTISRTHSIPVAEIHLRAHHHYPLDLFAHFAGHAASALGIPATRPIPLPTQRSLWTVLRGPFIHKKSQENFERRIHKRVIKAWDADPVIVDRWVRYLRKHQMPGVGIRVTTWERAPLGVGKQIFEQAMEKVRPDPEEIKTLADKIVQQEMLTAGEGEPSRTDSPPASSQ